ncbi:PIN domain nuclease of toxin-antitoxin system [Novosphingobium hassiacum]|uniref:PIN domain nuclease of toxin-antitoxin system n=1 Tax=Novosphingobium hassiacum TaxID=173676 RepID=A0A7W6EXF4_9SPHN|nr:type II toxin-antitoxin system VapC family toxin [Novosphingobium hassiacum]MBB3862308.1 PIN domain nuclease of toxin-antitoxin system [Novosphingobium hassiacum]
MSEVVLDASALLALLRDEPGAGKVAEAIADSRMCSVNYAEVVSHFIHAGMPAGEVDAMLKPLPMAIVDADQGLATIAGRLRATTAEAGLSLGDRFCLALARRDGLTALTADKQWRIVADAAGVAVSVIR